MDNREALSSPSWGSLTLLCLSWETSRLVLGPFIQYAFSCLQLDILQSALDEDDPNHILCALPVPTGFEKTVPMLLLGHLLPQGAGIPILKPHAIHRRYRLHNNDHGAFDHHQAAAPRRLQETGPYCRCWQPGEHLKLPAMEENHTIYHRHWNFVLTSKEGFCGWIWGSVCSTPSSDHLQCWVSFFNQRLRRNSQLLGLLFQVRDVILGWRKLFGPETALFHEY